MKRLSARARKTRNKIIPNDSRCIPPGTIVSLDNGVTWLSAFDNGLVLVGR